MKGRKLSFRSPENVAKEGRKMIVVDEEKCDGCGSCVEVCPNEVLEVQDGISVVVNPDDCVECESCVAECPNEAITLE